MPRIKTYDEAEVAEKAMNLFWKNGYEGTSMQMLEKEMGINKFSIYASFGNKRGVLLESMSCYEKKLGELINKLDHSNNGVEGIKQYFYDFMEFSKEDNLCKGCLVTNMANELTEDADEKLKEALANFTHNVRQSFVSALRQDPSKNTETTEEQADFLLVSMFGFSSASKVFNQKQLDNYIKNIFKNL